MNEWVATTWNAIYTLREQTRFLAVFCIEQKPNTPHHSSIAYAWEEVYMNWSSCYLARPGGEGRHDGLYVLLLFLIFNDSCQTNYLKIYPTDLRQSFRVGRTMAVDDQTEISFSIP